MTDTTSSDTPRILFVCLGNICRSPAAEAITRTLASRAGLDLQLDSAGTGSWHIGEPPDRRMQSAALAAGYDVSGHRGRRVSALDFDRFDLIVAMDRENLADIETLRPAGSDTPVRLMLSYEPSGRMDVPDPYLEGGFDAVLRLIERAAEGLLDELRGTAG
ncbi:low molecular weight protein-tyrosine-phosphatase [Tropicimonas isoalkanivorans]|nr:low molecular weight protein-tyrosine-phosphatase [Tropicimonas isoalkanivorans]